MSTVALSLAAISTLSAMGLAAFVWMGIASVNDELRSLVSFDGPYIDD